MILILALLLAAAPTGGGTPLLCDDLAGIPETPRVDFESEIRTALFEDGRYFCTGCHNLDPLDLASSAAYEHLFCQPNRGIDSREGLLVIPFAPTESGLFLRVNCDAQDGGSFRMPQFGPEGPRLTLPEQALVRDWIAQGARPSAEDLFATSFELAETCLPLAAAAGGPAGDGDGL